MLHIKVIREVKPSCIWKINIYKYFRSSINRYYNLYVYFAILKKVITEVKHSYYNILIEISNNKVRTLWNVTGKIKRAEKISEMNLGAGNIEIAKQMAYAFHKLFLFILQHWHESVILGRACGLRVKVKFSILCYNLPKVSLHQFLEGWWT
jgi:hypothetical protein